MLGLVRIGHISRPVDPGYAGHTHEPAREQTSGTALRHSDRVVLFLKQLHDRLLESALLVGGIDMHAEALLYLL